MRSRDLIAICLLLAACTVSPPPPSASPESTSASPQETATGAVTPTTSPPPSAGAPTFGGSDAPTPQPPAGSHLLDALRVMPDDATRLDFTDWSLMRASDGMPERGDRMSDEERRQFLGSIFRRHATPSAFAFHKIHSHRQAWGWDNTDLLWEATISFGQEAVHAVRLPNYLAIGELEARFADYGFEREERGSVVRFTGDLDPRGEWLRASAVAMKNSALVPDERLLLASTNADLLERTIATALGDARSAGEPSAVDAAVTAAGDLVAAVAFVGNRVCRSVGPTWLLPEDRAWLMSLFPELNHFDALVVGYRYEAAIPVGRIALGYSDAAAARDDLATRMLLADGPALSSWAGWDELDMSDLYFSLEGGRVEGSAILLDSRIAGDRPELLVNMVHAGDVLFAMC